MITLLTAASLFLAQSAGDAPATPEVTVSLPDLPIEQATSLRCAGALAVTAAKQQNGDADALRYPMLGDRGREFFVQTMARLMDEAKLTRPALRWYLVKEAEALKEPGRLDQVMPACLMLLDASGIEGGPKKPAE